MIKNIKVGTRLLLAFLLVAALSAIAAGIGILNMASMNAQAEHTYGDDLLGISASKQANIHAVQLGRVLGGVLAAGTAENKRIFMAAVRDAHQALRDSLARARPLYVTPAGKTLFAELDRNVREFDIALERLLALVQDETPEGKVAAVEYAFTSFATRSITVDERLSALAVQKEKAAAAGKVESSRKYQDSRTLMLVLMLTTLALSVVLGAWITRMLRGQLGGEPSYAAAIADAIARGDLTASIIIRGGDRNSLLHAMESMRLALVRIVGQVRNGTDTIATQRARSLQVTWTCPREQNSRPARSKRLPRRWNSSLEPCARTPTTRARPTCWRAPHRPWLYVVAVWWQCGGRSGQHDERDQRFVAQDCRHH